MSPSTLTDGALQSACADSYRALYESCRDAELARWPAERQVSELARLVSDFALCARVARLRPDRVLADLRAALAPIVHSDRVPVTALIQRAIVDYYAASQA